MTSFSVLYKKPTRRMITLSSRFEVLRRAACNHETITVEPSVHSLRAPPPEGLTLFPLMFRAPHLLFVLLFHLMLVICPAVFTKRHGVYLTNVTTATTGAFPYRFPSL